MSAAPDLSRDTEPSRPARGTTPRRREGDERTGRDDRTGRSRSAEPGRARPAPDPVPTAPWRQRSWQITGVAAVAAVLAGTGTVVHRHLNPPPINLPAAVAGLAAVPSGSDVMLSPTWLSNARTTVGGHEVAGRSYRTGSRTLRLVAARGNLAGKLDLRMVGDAGTAVGDVRCTQQFRFGRAAPSSRPTMMLCWQTGDGRSAYALAVNPDGPSRAEVAEAVEQAWALIG